MRIECPDCAAAYEVPDQLLAGRKALRCARCGAEFLPADRPEEAGRLDLTQVVGAAETPDARPEPVTPAPLTPAPLTPAPLTQAPLPTARPRLARSTDRPAFSAMQRLVQPIEPPKRSVWPLVAWAASLIVLLALVGGAFVWRAQIMHVWPPSARVYATLGLSDPGR